MNATRNQLLSVIIIMILTFGCSLCNGCMNGTVRLVGGEMSAEGSIASEGRVEICFNGEWGTVCDDFWEELDASVVCRELGFAQTGAMPVSFGEGSGPIWLDDVMCLGDEMRLADCPASLLGQHNCNHTTDAGVMCQITVSEPACNHSEVRLVGGCDSLEGRVEVCVDGEWGTVCDDFWDDDDAQVVCRQLGHTTGSALGFRRALYGEGTGPIFLDTVECQGNERMLLDCGSNPIEVHDCHHFEDASVSCFQKGCTDGDVRLAEGSFFSGRVEVCQAGLWGTVCDDLWGEEDASVVCGQLGLMSEGAEAESVGPGCGPIFFDNVECTRTEERLVDCSRAFFGNCNHSKDAGVRCSQTNLNFVPFGSTEGDNSISDASVSPLGPLSLPTPVVYYLKEEYQIYVSITGNVMFEQEPEEANSSIAMISPQWPISLNSTTLYARVAEDTPTLDMVTQILTNENPEMRDFLPSLAVIMTWHNSDSEKGTLQAILSTNRQASFATYLFSDGHGVGILKHTDLLVFTAGDRIRSSVPQNGNFDLERLRAMLNSFRIDGHCVTLDSPGRACSLRSYSVICENALSASTCRCYQSAPQRNQSIDDGISGSGRNETTDAGIEMMNETTEAEMNEMSQAADAEVNVSETLDSEISRMNETGDADMKDTLNATDPEMSGSGTPNPGMDLDAMPTNATTHVQSETCETTTISCVSGSVASPCIPPSGAPDTGYSGCYPTLLPCYIQENCLDQAELTDCDSGFTAFGEGAGDSRGEREDDASFGPIVTDIPIIFFGSPQKTTFMSTNGILSFKSKHSTFMICELPCTSPPIIAPVWIDLDFRASGVMFYRSSQDPVILGQIASAIANVNPVLADYRPTQAVVFTWFEARSHFDDEQTMLGDKQGSFQLVLSSDGKSSFATFVYADPEVIFQNVLEPELDEDYPLIVVEASIGFDGGEETLGADYGQFLKRNGRLLQAVNTFRIDGLCVTTIQPRDACSLEANTTECDGFTATTCQCETGYEYDYNEELCVDINECNENRCHEDSDCFNSPGSFRCVCKTGYMGDGFQCRDINECLLGICGSFSQCFNSEGNFTCVCDQGYDLVGRNVCLEVVLPTGTPLSPAGPIVACVGGALLVVGVAIVVGLLVRKQRRKNKEGLLNDDEDDANYFDSLRGMTVQSSFELNVDKSLVVNSCNIQLGKTLGQGKFGVVYRALLKKGFQQGFTETVAVKTLKGFIQKKLVTAMLKECDKIKDFDHPNVLGLKGVCLDGGPAPFIITAFMSNGSLLSYLRDNKGTFVMDPKTDPDDTEDTQKRLLDMCIQVAKGMNYLAKQRVVHRDLSAKNCMINSSFVIKVADFELSVALEPEADYHHQEEEEQVELATKWLAPESISDKIFSEKTDVWAYGVTCWEIFTGGSVPYSDINLKNLLRKLNDGYRMKKPANAACTETTYGVVLKCWEEKSETRPAFSTCVQDFSRCLSHVAKYFDLGFMNQGFVPIEDETENDDATAETESETEMETIIFD